MTALMDAAEQDKSHVVEVLLASGADATMRDKVAQALLIPLSHTQSRMQLILLLGRQDGQPAASLWAALILTRC